MAIEVVPHADEHADAVEAFNARMRAGGSPWGFYVDPVPRWIPWETGATVWREYHLAIEDSEYVRGGYALKPQQWLVDGEQLVLADWQGPYTEADIDPRYSPLMLRLARNAAKQCANLFSFGHSGKDVDILTKMGWGTISVPFCFFVANAGNFFRQATYVRTSGFRRLVCNLLAYTGLGALCMKLLQFGIRVRNRQDVPAAAAHVVDSFGPWADELWEAAKDDYGCLAVRDRKTMNRILPATGWPGGTRLKIEVAGETVGWSVVLINQMQNDPRYGDMRVGLIADAFGAAESSAAVIAATVDYLRSENVDMICCNMFHRQWVDALRAAGFVVLPERRTFAFAKTLRARLEKFADSGAGLHLTNLDGHGPHGYTSDG